MAYNQAYITAYTKQELQEEDPFHDTPPAYTAEKPNAISPSNSSYGPSTSTNVYAASSSSNSPPQQQRTYPVDTKRAPGYESSVVYSSEEKQRAVSPPQQTYHDEKRSPFPSPQPQSRGVSPQPQYQASPQQQQSFLSVPPQQPMYQQQSNLMQQQPMQQPMMQQQPVMNNGYRYDNNRGPIGNLINLAATSVMNSNNTAAVNATSMESRNAYGVVNGFLANRLQHRGNREYIKEMKEQQKMYEKQMKEERKTMRKYGYMPQQQFVQQPQMLGQQQFVQQPMQQQQFVQQQYVQQPQMMGQQSMTMQQPPIIVQQQSQSHSHILGDILLAEAIL